MSDERNFECIICYEDLLSPIYQCHDGHLLCKDCIPKVTKCPVCQDDFSKTKRIRNRALEEMASAARRKHCPCNAELKDEEIEKHMLDCRKAIMNFCRYLGITGCQEEVARTELVNHLKSKHKVEVIKDPPNYLAIRQTMPTWTNEGVFMWKPVCFLKYGQLFYLQTKIAHGHWITWHVYVLGSVEVAKKWYLEIEEMFPDTGGRISKDLKVLSPLIKPGEPKPLMLRPFAFLSDSWTIIVTLLSAKPSPKDGYIFQDSPGLKDFLQSVPASGDPGRSAALFEKHQYCCFDCGAVNFGSYCRPGKRRHKDSILVISDGAMSTAVPWSAMNNKVCDKYVTGRTLLCGCLVARGPLATEI